VPPVALTQHPDEHRAQRPVLLAVDQEDYTGSSCGAGIADNASVSRDRGTSPEYPDVRYTLDRWVPNGLSQEHSEQDIERITEDHPRGE
jgi:hypothetical protein